MAATVGSGGFTKASVAVVTYKNESLPQLQNQNVNPQQQNIHNRMLQENANLHSAEFSNLMRSESGVKIGQQVNRNDTGSGKSAFRTPDKRTHGYLGQKLIEKQNYFCSDGMQKRRQNGSIISENQFSPILRKDSFMPQAHQQHLVEAEVNPNASNNIFMTQKKPQSQAEQKLLPGFKEASNAFHKSQSRNHQQQLNTFFITSKKLDIDSPPKTTIVNNKSCMTQLEHEVSGDSPFGVGNQQKFRRVSCDNANQLCKNESELSNRRQIDTRQYLIKLAQPAPIHQNQIQAISGVNKQFPLIKRDQVVEPTYSQLVGKSAHQKYRKKAIRSPDTVHEALRQHQIEHQNILAHPVSTSENVHLRNSKQKGTQDQNVQAQKEAKYDALQVIQNLIFETSCNPNLMGSTKCIQQAQLYQFHAAHQRFQSQRNNKLCHTPKEMPKKQDLSNITVLQRQEFNLQTKPSSHIVKTLSNSPNMFISTKKRKQLYPQPGNSRTPNIVSRVNLNCYTPNF